MASWSDLAGFDTARLDEYNLPIFIRQARTYGRLCGLQMNAKRTTIRIKRVYDEPERVDGRRILVDRLWPRGLPKQKAKVDAWMKEIAPTTELRRWYGHDQSKWTEFKRRYRAELDANPDQVEALLKEVRKGTVTFLYGAKETRLNNAVALKEYMESLIDE